MAEASLRSVLNSSCASLRSVNVVLGGWPSAGAAESMILASERLIFSFSGSAKKTR